MLEMNRENLRHVRLVTYRKMDASVVLNVGVGGGPEHDLDWGAGDSRRIVGGDSGLLMVLLLLQAITGHHFQKTAVRHNSIFYTRADMIGRNPEEVLTEVEAEMRLGEHVH